MSVKLRSLISTARSKLQPHYSEVEASALVREIMFRLKGFTPVDLVVKADTEMSPFIVEKVNAIIDRLLLDEPIQYIFGVARFYGMDFQVTPSVLIPRQETVELVDIIVKDFNGRHDLRILDLCTGSGAIAIALARNLPFSRVDAVDISNEAITVAKNNSTNLRTKVSFYIADVLKLSNTQNDPYDIIVCNPPYITDSEKASVDPNVLLYEPHSALFVPDTDPLIFFHAVSKYAFHNLKPNGTLYFEINPRYANEIIDLLKHNGWHDAYLLRDISGKNRFVVAHL